MFFEPTEKDLRDLNELRLKVGLHAIDKGVIKTNRQWQQACNEIDELAEPMLNECPHGNPADECEACFQEADFRYDCDREANFFDR